MLLRAGDQHQAQTGAAKWQSFSIRNVLGDTLDDDHDDAEEDVDVVVDAGGRPASIDGQTTPPCDGSFPTDSSPGAGSSDASGNDDMNRDDRQNDDVQRTSDSSLRCTDELRDYSRWTAFQAAPNVIITSSQHPAALNQRYSNHGNTKMHILHAYQQCLILLQCRNLDVRVAQTRYRQRNMRKLN